MPFFSIDRDIVFTPDERPVYLFGDFPDFYALLQIKRSATREEVETAILEAGSQLLAASLARGKSERVRLLEYYLPVLRRALLEPEVRVNYNTVLKRHQSGAASDEEAVDFFAALWAQENATKSQNSAGTGSPLARLLRRALRS